LENSDSQQGNVVVVSSSSSSVIEDNGFSKFPEYAVVDMGDFVAAAKGIQPTAKREGFAVVPDVTWNDVGALAEVTIITISALLISNVHPFIFIFFFW
jgi:SpoVK/Ycf46/Vps4 family AAA+-type ATPase